MESSPRIGGVAESGDVQWYLRNVAYDIRGFHGIFGDRRRQPLKAALLLTAISRFSSALPEGNDFDHILAGGGALAAVYLLSQLEYLFRMKSRYLNEDGTVVRKLPPTLLNELSVNGNLNRINQIKHAFKIYLFYNSAPLARRLSALEKQISISERLGYIRNPAMHGPLGDIAVESSFYGLLISMFYYAERAMLSS